MKRAFKKKSKMKDFNTTETKHIMELESQTESKLGPKEKKTMKRASKKKSKKRAFKKKSKMQDSNNTKISELRSENKEFLHTIHKYLDCREKMDAKYLEVDELQTIAKFQLTTDSGGIETDSDDKFEFKTEYQQHSIKAEPVKTLQELYAAAKIIKPIYQDTITRIVDQVCEALGDQKDTVEVDFAPLKGRDRAQAKADDDYSKRNPGPCISWLFDIVRGSIKFSTCEQVAKFVELVQEDPSIHIVKAKNRFATPTLTGYRDLNLCIQVDTHQGFKHICEIQIHHGAIKFMDTQLKSHVHYEYFRSYFAGATDSLKDRLDDLKAISHCGAVDESFLHELLENSTDEVRLEKLGDLFRDQLCEYHWALEFYRKALEIKKKTLGEEHSDVANAYSNMAVVLRSQGKLDDAMELYRKALEIKKKTLGEDHSSVAETYNNMGLVLLDSQGNLDDAMELHRKALEIKKKTLGEDHSSVAMTYNNMANVLKSQGKLDDAMELYWKALEIMKKTLGEDHPTVACTYNNMGLVLQSQGKLEDAMELHRKALEIYKKTLGEEHSSVASTYNNMASVLQSQGKLDDAMELYRKALEIKKKTLGEDHSSVADTYNIMANVFETQGKLDDAMELYRKALEIKKKTLGQEHSSVAVTYNNMANVLKRQGKLDDAMELLGKALKIKKKTLGEDHSSVAHGECI
jgi:tetratricopeptide (TPR) repeat protein